MGRFRIGWASSFVLKQVAVDVIITRGAFRTVSYMALDKSVFGTLPQWQFLQDFQPVRESKKKVLPVWIEH